MEEKLTLREALAVIATRQCDSAGDAKVMRHMARSALENAVDHEARRVAEIQRLGELLAQAREKTDRLLIGMEEVLTRADNMAGMKLTELQQQTLSNVVEPARSALAGEDADTSLVATLYRHSEQDIREALEVLGYADHCKSLAGAALADALAQACAEEEWGDDFEAQVVAALTAYRETIKVVLG